VKDPRDIIIRPIVSEKSYGLIEREKPVYTFVVAKAASKPEIRDAIESIFDVKVVKVNTLNRPGKVKRNRRTGVMGSKGDTKRAMVTLAPDQEISLFES